jgi:ABC-type antimicrobial peptide transport system permease subunit
MCFFFSLIPATVWAVIGFFVLYVSTKADGGLSKFGRALAIWAFVIAALFPLAGAYVTLAGLCPMEAMMETMHPELTSSAIGIALSCACGLG